MKMLSGNNPCHLTILVHVVLCSGTAKELQIYSSTEQLFPYNLG